MNKPLPQRTFYVAALLLVFGLSACETNVDPILGTDAGPTLFGFIDPTNPRQAIRVFEFADQLIQSRPDPLSSIVSITDVETGASVALRDSVVQFENGTFGHIYTTRFQPAFERLYRIEGTTDDSPVSTAVVLTPPDVEPTLGGERITPTSVRLPLEWPEAPLLLDIEVAYVFDVRRNGRRFVETIPFDYTSRQVQTAAGWAIEVDLTNDARTIFARDLFVDGSDVVFNRIEARAFVAFADWVSPIGSFDPEILVEPGTFSNVEDGFGFVGAGYQRVLPWSPSDEALEAVGFGRTDEDG